MGARAVAQSWPQAMTNSRSKGKRGELEFAQLLRDAGLVAWRGQQFAGGTESPDVVCESLPHVHFEIKRVEQLNLLAAMAQSVTDAGHKLPVVAHRRNKQPWLVTMRVQDFIELARSADPAPWTL